MPSTGAKSESQSRHFPFTLHHILRPRDSLRILAGEAAKGVGDGLPEVGYGLRLGCAQQGFEFCERHSDGIEVGTVGREVFEIP